MPDERCSDNIGKMDTFRDSPKLASLTEIGRSFGKNRKMQRSVPLRPE
jgi:hypothetical protein